MKLVTGIFTPDDVADAMERLVQAGFSYDDFSLMTSADQMPEFLEGDSKQSAVSGAALGAVTGGAFGALGTFVASTLPGFQSIAVSGLMATTLSSVVGAYLGSLYSVRAANQVPMDIHEALESGDLLLVVRTPPEMVTATMATMETANGRDVVEVDIPAEQVDETLS